MRTRIAAVTAGLVILPGSWLLCIAPTHADPSSGEAAYLRDLANDGVVPDSTLTASELIKLGYTVCTALNKGESIYQVADVISGPGISETQAVTIAGSAANDLCP